MPAGWRLPGRGAAPELLPLNAALGAWVLPSNGLLRRLTI